MPPYPNGSLQQQLTQQYSYLFQMAQQLNMALTALEGDRGGSAVIRQHPEDLVLLEVDALELTDVDTPQALAALSESAGTNR